MSDRTHVQGGGADTGAGIDRVQLRVDRPADEDVELGEQTVSELVTDVVRHGRGPVRLRLIRARSLICEVSDASSTSPHLRHAASVDEGGRGLFMIAQLADAWGTRYTAIGKTIWTRQTVPLPRSDAESRSAALTRCVPACPRLRHRVLPARRTRGGPLPVPAAGSDDQLSTRMPARTRSTACTAHRG
ncbi:ATP-binding protein [Streptomyces sp. NPDC093060]|uniref:ATP-binding protein n=1 Tax=Streptomyces sp. NPDC093060 TaxID=3366019 RepID=UPI003829D6A1